MAHRITIADVARQAGVSLMTVSRVVNNKEDVSDSTRQHVLEIIDKLGYRPSSIARGLVTHRTSTLGVVVPDIDNPFFSGVVGGAENMAYAEGYNVLLCNTNEDPDREIAVLHSLEEKQIDGLLLCSSRLKISDLKNIVERFPAVVLTSRHVDKTSAGLALIDEVAGGGQATEHLFSRGHQKIGFVSGPRISYSAKMRMKGYHRALEAHDLPYRPEWVRSGASNVADGQRISRELLQDYPELTALICHNDLAAVGALQACAELGLDVPGDLAVIGYDDIPIAALVTPTLTTCQIPRTDLGEGAMEMLLNQINNGSNSNQTVILSPKLVVRQSAP